MPHEVLHSSFNANLHRFLLLLVWNMHKNRLQHAILNGSFFSLSMRNKCVWVCVQWVCKALSHASVFIFAFHKFVCSFLLLLKRNIKIYTHTHQSRTNIYCDYKILFAHTRTHTENPISINKQLKIRHSHISSTFGCCFANPSTPNRLIIRCVLALCVFCSPWVHMA